MNKRIAVIGNGGGGKTTLSRQLGKFYDIPVVHVDAIQYQRDWTNTPQHVCDKILNEVADGDSWLIDGFGSKPVIKRRLALADTVVFVDLPLYQHYLWAGKRQLGSWRGARSELPPGCSEFSLGYTVKLAKVMWQVNRDHVPWFRSLIPQLPDSTSLFHLQSTQQVKRLLDRHLR